jgi:uncharacterized membrane protein YdjX (TVP38/TMEM64 family)
VTAAAPGRNRGLAGGAGLAILIASALGLLVLFRDDGQLLLLGLGRLESAIEASPLMAMLAFVLSMAVLTCLTLPTVTLLCLSAGYLFGALPGAILAWIGALSGATLTFLVLKFIAGDRVRGHLLGGRSGRLVELLERDAFFYLVALRIVPIAPFFAINAAGALIRIPLRRFALATALGLLPLLTIYVNVGASVDTLVEANRIDARAVLSQPRVFLPLLALLVVTGLGWALRRRIARRQQDDSQASTA